MKLQLHAVRLRAITSQGAWGREVRFGPGFNVIRGGNNRGKTQVVQAIIYGLGLERMLQARANAPLGSVMTSELRTSDQDDSPVVSVLKSWVAVEFGNERGRVVTAQRHVRHDTLDRDLVRVWEGPALTGTHAIDLAPQDMFLHRPGSASRELGFHKFLTDFIGWELPQVSTYGGTTIPLYPDVIFPFLIVDQQAWSSVSPRKVDRYQIRDPLRRAAEFLLGLSEPETLARRTELEQEIANLRSQWAAARSSATTLAQSVGGLLTGVAEHPVGAHRGTPSGPTTLERASIELPRGGDWVPLAEVAAEVARDLAAMNATPPRRLESDVDPQALLERERVRSELGDVVAAARLLESNMSMEEAQVAALERRLTGLQEERDRNLDIRTLVRLGSETDASHLADHNCPTCQQSLEAVEAGDLGPTLDVDSTVSLLNAQISTAQKMLSRSKEAVGQAGAAYAAMQRESDQLRIRLKALEQDLLASARAPSSGDIARQLTLGIRATELERTSAALEPLLEKLADTAQTIAATRTLLNELPAGEPASDITQLADVTASMRARLSESGFGSYSASDVTLDQDSLRPTRRGFDMDVDASASDVIRIKIAYLDAVRLSGQENGPHPGLLVLDEPRQQDIDPNDFSTILRRLAASNQDGGQVIVTSATPRSELDQLLTTAAVTVTDINDQRLLQPEGGTHPLDR